MFVFLNFQFCLRYYAEAAKFVFSVQQSNLPREHRHSETRMAVSWLELISKVPSLFEPVKFYCMTMRTGTVKAGQ